MGWKASTHFLQGQSTAQRLQVAALAPAREQGWRERARPIKPGAPYPAKDHCSNCGLCDTYYVAHVKEACAFLGEGESSAFTALMSASMQATKLMEHFIGRNVQG